MALRIGILNLMPKLETYEPLLLGPLSRASVEVEPVWLRLETHSYESSDPAHLARSYRTLDSALDSGPLDGLLLTGAPVEQLEFDEVRYWPELYDVLSYARAEIPSTLGLCWGGLALGHVLGIPKTVYRQKVFGVFENTTLDPETPLLRAHPRSFRCAHSRHSGISDSALERADRDGLVRPLSHSLETGYSLFETPDHRFVAHLGHPEYVAERLVFEYRRDRALGRADVPAPRHFDPDAPDHSWQAHGDAFFDGWVALLADAQSARRPARLSPPSPRAPRAAPAHAVSRARR